MTCRPARPRAGSASPNVSVIAERKHSCPCAAQHAQDATPTRFAFARCRGADAHGKSSTTAADKSDVQFGTLARRASAAPKQTISLSANTAMRRVRCKARRAGVAEDCPTAASRVRASEARRQTHHDDLSPYAGPYSLVKELVVCVEHQTRTSPTPASAARPSGSDRKRAPCKNAHALYKPVHATTTCDYPSNTTHRTARPGDPDKMWAPGLLTSAPERVQGDRLRNM